MKILHLAKAYPPETGGVETYSEQTAMAYSRVGHDVTVVTAHRGVPGQEYRGDVRIVNVGHQGGQVVVFWRMLVQLWALRREEFDIAHATTWRVALPVLLLRHRLPLIVTIHGREVFVVPRFLRPLMLGVLRHAKHLPTVSQPILEKLEGDLETKLHGAFANWNGVSFEEESRLPQEKPDGVRIFCMCRLVKRKNLHGAIHAVARLVARGYQLEFLVAGGGEEAPRLAGMINELGMQGHIKMLGRVGDAEVSSLYGSSHIFLHPQIATRSGRDMEGFGLTIADAMAFRCVPVVGKSGGPMDFIQHGETGYLVDGEDVDQIAAALKTLIENPERRDAMASAAQKFARERLTWKTHVARILGRIA